MPTLLETFATNLRYLRLTCNESQEELAQRTRLSLSYISMLERGTRSPPLPTLERCAKAYNVTPAYLLQDNDLEDIDIDLRRRRRDR
jgi:transcriptional regulator with XRE-family HTH domain